jgi:DNA-directed RNA polymerase beta subunit
MTAGTVLEPLMGLSTALGGHLTDIAGHRDYDLAGIRDTLIRNGYNSHGTQSLYSGTSGKRITAEIFVGLQRVNQLGHIAAEKIQCRATGKNNKVNRQADASKYGETRNKGQKIGESERNQLIKYGASFVIQDKMNISCDGVTVVVCKICSSYASYDKTMRSFSCPKCGLTSLGETESSRFGRFIMPQTARYTHSLLVSLGVNPKLKFVDRGTYIDQAPTRGSRLDLAGDAIDGDGFDDQ